MAGDWQVRNEYLKRGAPTGGQIPFKPGFASAAPHITVKGQETDFGNPLLLAISLSWQNRLPPSHRTEIPAFPHTETERTNQIEGSSGEGEGGQIESKQLVASLPPSLLAQLSHTPRTPGRRPAFLLARRRTLGE